MNNLKTTNHKVIIGDARRMTETDNGAVQLIVTSPPYWQIKDYGKGDQQIGFNETYEEYISSLNQVWDECYRVLEDGCRLCVNIGDQFARAATYGRYKVIPIREEIIRHCESIGFDYMGAIIWQKKTTMKTTGGASVMGSFPYPRNGLVEIDYEFILLFKKLGKHESTISKETKVASVMTKEEWRKYFTGHWNFAGVRQNDHVAMFPEELPRRLIKMFSFVGETVLDPFLGSGTTSKVARELRRSSVGYEINEDFVALITKKIHDFGGTLFDGADDVVDVVYQNRLSGVTKSKRKVGVSAALSHRVADPNAWKIKATSKQIETLAEA